jgi:hypothetical protein
MWDEGTSQSSINITLSKYLLKYWVVYIHCSNVQYLSALFRSCRIFSGSSPSSVAISFLQKLKIHCEPLKTSKPTLTSRRDLLYHNAMGVIGEEWSLPDKKIYNIQ